MSTDIARAQARPSLLAKFGRQYSLDPKVFLETVSKTVFKEAKTQEQVITLLMVADQYGLSPITKEIYAFPDKGGGVIPVVGVDGWNRIAQQHPQFYGIDFRYAETDVVPDGGKRCPEWIEACVYRKDRTHPVVVREYLDECFRKTGPWQSHTKRMLRHKATIQGYRMAFGFHGIYEPDEAERMAEAGPLDVPSANVSDRVLGRIAPQRAEVVDEVSGEVIDVEPATPTEPAESDDATANKGDDGPEPDWEPESAESEDDDGEELDLALGNVEPIRQPAITAAQLKAIKGLVKDLGVYEVELVSVLDSYNAQTIEGLTKKNAEFVLAALKERQP